MQASAISLMKNGVGAADGHGVDAFRDHSSKALRNCGSRSSQVARAPNAPAADRLHRPASYPANGQHAGMVAAHHACTDDPDAQCALGSVFAPDADPFEPMSSTQQTFSVVTSRRVL